jgi:two-component system, response regulator PdtaR
MKSLRILVVEDDALIAMVLGELLEGMGHEVCDTAGTQADAVASAIRHRPDMMIVDGALRQGNGIAAVDEILLGGPLPHVFVSGDTGRIKAHRPDAAVLRKPFRLAELGGAIDTAFAAAAA